MLDKIIKEEWDVLTRFLPDGWKEEAVCSGALTRRRKIDSPETLLRLLLIHLADGKSLRTTVTYANQAGLCDINDVALLHRLRASERWFLWMAQQLWKDIIPPVETCKILEKFNMRLIDASMIKEPGASGSNWRLHYSLNLVSLRCDTFNLTDDKTGEGFIHFEIREGDLLIGDRAYCKKTGLLHVMDHSAHMLVRFHSTAMPLSTYRGGMFQLLPRLRKLEAGCVGDWNVYLFRKDGSRVKLRLCAMRKSKEASEIAKKKIRRNASRKQVKTKTETFEYAEYIILVTSVNRHHLKGNDILELYRIRWQVELAFKRLKSIMDLGHLPKREASSSKAWLYGKLFVALLVERVRQEAVFFSPWGIPF